MNSGNRQLLNPDRRLRAGCYYMRFEPTYPYWGDDNPPEDREREVRIYAGTMRVVHYNNEGTKAFSPKETENGKTGLVVNISGDLYAIAPLAEACGCGDIPIFPVSDYRFYVLATRIEEGERGEFTLFLDSYEFNAGPGSPPYAVKAKLRWSKAPTDSHSAFDYLEGPVCDECDNEIGRVTLNWMSDYLRRAVIEIDRVNDVAAPLDNHTGIETGLLTHIKRTKWDEVFEPCGWRVEAKISDQPAEPASKIWTEPELHEAVPELRDTFDVAHEWRYHIFCVGKLDDGGRGYEFKSDGAVRDSGIFESVVLAAKFEFVASDTDVEGKAWGKVQDRALDETPAYFRTAVHEIGHALNLEHNFNSPGFMATTDAVREIAQRQLNDRMNGTERDHNGNRPWSRRKWDFLDAIQWEFAPDDQERLRHWPDIVVRPGTERRPRFLLPGIDTFRFDPLFGGADENGPELNLDFEIRPFRERVPLGAPVRILLTLTNKGEREIKVPQLRMKAGNITGRVQSRSGEAREFLPLSGPDDELGMRSLLPQQSAHGSLTLLAGPDGPLFPEPGPYTVTVDLQIYRRGKYNSVSRATEVWVDPFVDEQHRRIATLLLQSRTALVNFVIGSGPSEGDQAINLALNNPVLAPHYLIATLKRLCRDIKRTTGSLDHALLILAKGQPILTDLEIATLLRKRRPMLTDREVAIIASSLKQRKANGSPADALRQADPHLTDREIAVLLSKREPVLTEWELAGLVRTGRTALGVQAREDEAADDRKDNSKKVTRGSGRKRQHQQPAFEIPNALVADLEYFGTRIVLGKMKNGTLKAFVLAIKRGLKDLKKNVNPSRTRKMLMKVLEENVGLSGTGSYELAELLLAHDTKIFKAIQEYNPRKTSSKQNVQEALEGIGLSTEDLRRIVGRLKEVIEIEPTLLDKNILIQTCDQIPNLLRDISIRKGLGLAFKKALKANLEALKKMINEDEAEQDKPKNVGRKNMRHRKKKRVVNKPKRKNYPVSQSGGRP